MFLQDRLIANDFIQCRKVAEHVLEKILGGNDTGTGSNSSNQTQSQGSSQQAPAPARPTANGESPGEAPEDKIELLCCEQVFY